MSQTSCTSQFISNLLGDIIAIEAFHPTAEGIERAQTGVSQALTALTENAPQQSQGDIFKGSLDCAQRTASKAASSLSSEIYLAVIVMLVVLLIACALLCITVMSEESVALKLFVVSSIVVVDVILSTYAMSTVIISVDDSTCASSIEKKEAVYEFQTYQSINSAMCAY